MRTGKPTLLQEADRLKLFHSGEHPCGYWPQRTARDLVLDPRDPRLPQLYPMTLDWGFRRSGDLLYRPHCRARTRRTAPAGPRARPGAHGTAACARPHR